MEKRIFSVKDKLFLGLFILGWTAISYATYKVIGIKSGEEKFSLVQAIKTTVSDFMG